MKLIMKQTDRQKHAPEWVRTSDPVLRSPEHYLSTTGLISQYLLMSLQDRCPLIRESLEDRFYCIEGVLSSESPLKTDFTE